MTELMQKILAEIAEMPETEQDIYAGLMLAHFTRVRRRNFAQSQAARHLWRLSPEAPEYAGNRIRARQERAAAAEHFIGLVLLVDWDPIGLLGNPATEREYARYVPSIRDLLFSYPTVEAVADHLYTIEREQMELDRKNREWRAARRAELMQVAQKLVSLSDGWKLTPAAEGPLG